jgi:hypothetical protein
MTVDHGLPEPCQARTESDFVALLRRLKDWSGLTYRQLETRARRHGVQLPRSTVAAALCRQSLPREEVVEGVVRACGHDPAPWLKARAGLTRPQAPPLSAAEPDPGGAPRQLPPAVTVPVGREAELARLAGLLDAGSRVIVVSGLPGGGKSTVALHAVRRTAARFPGGQLYVNLQGTEPDARPLPTREIIARLLRGLRVADSTIPETAGEAAALLRTIVAGRSLLVLLDGVVSAAQVRDLLPLGGGSTVVLTSRHRLSTLEGVDRVVVGPLSPAGAMTMLEQLLGAERVRREPVGTARLAELCGYLPLALRVAAARLAVHADWPVEALVARLGPACRRLSELAVDDVDVAGSLALSYRALAASADRDALRVFHLAGTLPGPEVEAGTVAGALGISAAAADRAIESLVEAHLVENVDAVRYRMHDLVWQLARERAGADSPEVALSAVR